MVIRRKNTGLTLLEIMIAVVLLGILASVTVPRVVSIVERSRGGEAREILYKCYAGYQRLIDDGETISGAPNQLNWTRMGMSNPSAPAARFFDYTIRPNANSPTAVRATRRAPGTGYIEINLQTGVVTNTSPF